MRYTIKRLKGLFVYFSIYKKAGLLGQKKQDVTYVVAKKGIGKRVKRPSGVSGRFKVSCNMMSFLYILGSCIIF